MPRPLCHFVALALVATIPAGALLTDTPAEAAGPKSDRALVAALDGNQRSPANRARDVYRHPGQTLGFFGIKPRMTVVEIWPGTGWYTEILAPYLAPRGKLIIASPPGRGSASIEQRMASDPATFAKIERANFPSMLGGPIPQMAAGKADHEQGGRCAAPPFDQPC